ncbi:dermonecrotic toxin domain-containing protein [Pseudomonas putida]
MEQMNTEDSLHNLAARLVEACPDMRQQARDIALELLSIHNLSALDPDDVYLHRFTTAVSSPRSFSGWKHYEKPFRSMTLPQLVMHRFNAEDQDNADLLSYLTGFYREGPEKESYDTHNEVPLAPEEVLNFFWSIDFSSTFKARLASFWSTHSDDFRTLAKANFLGKVLQAHASAPGTALAQCCAEVATALTGGHFWPPTLEQLEQTVVAAEGIRLCAFDIGGYLATDMLRVEMPDGRQLLYTPGAIDALHLFADRIELYWWVLINNNYDENRARFSSHFALKDRGESGDKAGLDHLTDLLYEGWGKHTYAGLNVLDQTIVEDPFSWLRDHARQRMFDDAQHALHSNADLRKQMWIGYLQAFDQVFAPLAALDWPIALVTVGAGLAETGLNIDQAVNGRTTAERKAGITGAVLAAINALFNATFLLGAPGASGDGELAGLETEKEPQQILPEAIDDELQAWVPKPFWPSETTKMLAPFETNVILSGEPGIGRRAGVYLQQGKFYVLIESMPYQVRFVEELQNWVIIDPANPYSFYIAHIVRLDAAGKWQLAPRLRLPGAGFMDTLRTWGRQSSREQMLALPATPYEVPEALRPQLRNAAISTRSSGALSGILADLTQPEMEQAYTQFRALRDKLAADAAEFLASAELPARPALPELSAGASPHELLQKAYERASGLVVGESHNAIGSKRLLVDNMGLIRKQKVKTLYMEHFMTDFQQADLDTFHRTGRMPENLDHYVSAQDAGHRTDSSGRYTFRRVLVEAQKHGIHVQAIDCMASYRQAWAQPPGAQIRQQMMNFYAHRVIEADQALRGAHRWIALVGNSHANLFENVPGISELEGVIGLRCEDVSVGQPDILDADPGIVLDDRVSGSWRVKSDLRLRAAVRIPPPASPELETLLPHPGDYTIEGADGQEVLVNRGRDMTLRRTPIQREGRFIYLKRADWPSIHKRRLPGLADLHSRLTMRGMTYRGASVL